MIRVGFWLTGLSVALGLARFLALWSLLKGLLNEIGKLPMAVAFEQLPDKVCRDFSKCLYSERPKDEHLNVAWQQLPSADRTPPAGSGSYRDHEFRERAKRLSERAGQYLAEELPSLWRLRSVNEAYGRNEPQAAGESQQPVGKGGAASDPAARESFVAVMTVIYLGQYLAQLRTLAWGLSLSSPLLLLAAASYPFQPERPLLYALVGLLAGVVGAILYVLWDANRNGLISRISKTAPNKFTPDRGLVGAAGQLVLPVVTVVVAHFLGVFRVVLEPLLGAAR
jgi:hypothetical protein